MPRRREPLTAAKVHATVWYVHAVAWPSGGWVKPRVRNNVVKLCCNVGVLRRGVAAIHSV